MRSKRAGNETGSLADFFPVLFVSELLGLKVVLARGPLLAVQGEREVREVRELAEFAFR